MVIFRKLDEKVVFREGRVRFTDRIGRTVSCLDVVESCCVGSPAGDDVSCAAFADGGECHFRNMTVPRAGTGNSESAGTAHVKGPVSMAG